MKSISIFDVQKVNKMFETKHIDYILKLKDACGSQSLFLECTGNKEDSNVLCDLINEVLKERFIHVVPGTINPYNLMVK